MSIVDSMKISNKKGNKNIIEDKKGSKKSKNNFIFNTIVNLDKYGPHKNKKISKSKSSSAILTKKKNCEIKKQILIPIKLKGPSIKTNNVKKKISYNNSTSELFNDRYQYLIINRINNNENQKKKKKNSQHNTVNYIANNFNLSSNKKDNKFHEIKVINSFAPLSNNNNPNSNCNKNNNNNASKYDELKRTNEKLILLFNEKLKENQKYKNKVNYLESKNEQILNKINKIKKENDKSAKILEKVIKLLQILKNNGLDVEEILENLSYTEDDDDLESNTNSDDIGSINSKLYNKNSPINSENYFSKNEGESIVSNNIKNHKLNKGSKVTLKDNSIPKLDMKKIYNNNTINVKKFENNNTHKHKNYSHSVGQ